MMILKKHKVIIFSILLYITSLPLLAQSRLDENGILHLWNYNADPYSIYHANEWEKLFQKIEREHNTNNNNSTTTNSSTTNSTNKKIKKWQV